LNKKATRSKKKDASMEELAKDKALEEDLKKVEAEALKKALRHRVDEYIAIAIGVGAVLLLWLLQEMGLY
jgi:hypothetical protein